VVLVDTSVWVSHFRETNNELTKLLTNAEVACHPFVVGELACGNLKNRTTIISLLEALPTAKTVEHEEVLAFIDARKVMGKGLGYIDVHLLASAILTSVSLWTLDKRLDKIAGEFRCSYDQKGQITRR
jgi:predicted nucleic acid-binding protein